MVTPHEQLITPWGEKIVPALRVVPEKAPLIVARRLFGMTKLRFSRLDWHFFRCNSGENETSTGPR